MHPYPQAMDPGPRPTDPEMDGIVHELEAAGLLIIGVDAEGRETWTLTSEDAQVARQVAMSTDVGALELMSALLGDGEVGDPRR